MKVSKAAISNARRIFGLCMVDGRLDEEKLRKAIHWLADRKPRGYRAILVALKRLVRLDEERRHAVIESAVALDEATKSRVAAAFGSKYDAKLEFSYRTNPELIAGLRIRVGSDVWDASVNGRLKRLVGTFR